MLIWPLRMLGHAASRRRHARRPGAGGCTRSSSTDPEIVDRPGAVGAARRRRARSASRACASATAPGRAVLDGLDLTIRGGEAVALVGATGSGKTTVARLLPRFYDVDAGRILARRRRRPRRAGRASCGAAIGIVFEDTFLFSDTVRENIAFADPEAPMDAGAPRPRRSPAPTRSSSALPDGYDTVIGEHGFSLSGGQRQRIAIARAILADPRVLILDDATSSVDPTKEHEIRAALGEVMDGRTTLIIAHRPATIALADRVVLLDDGRVVAEGTHQELLATLGPLPRGPRPAARRPPTSIAAGVRAIDAAGVARRHEGRRGSSGGPGRRGDAARPRRGARQVLRRLWRMLRPYRGQIVLATLVLVGQTACLLAGPCARAVGVDPGLYPDPDADRAEHRRRGLPRGRAPRAACSAGSVIWLVAPDRRDVPARPALAGLPPPPVARARLLREGEDRPARVAHDLRHRRAAGSHLAGPRDVRAERPDLRRCDHRHLHAELAARAVHARHRPAGAASPAAGSGASRTARTSRCASASRRTSRRCRRVSRACGSCRRSPASGPGRSGSTRRTRRSTTRTSRRSGSRRGTSRSSSSSASPASR